MSDGTRRTHPLDPPDMTRHTPRCLCPDCDTRRDVIAAMMQRMVQQAAADGSTVTWDGAWHITPPPEDED